MNEIKRICFFTSQTKVIQTLIEIYCNLMIGKTIKDIQEVVKDYDTKFGKIDSSRRKHDLLLKEEGAQVVDEGNDVLGINNDENEESNNEMADTDERNVQRAHHRRHQGIGQAHRAGDRRLLCRLRIADRLRRSMPPWCCASIVTLPKACLYPLIGTT